MLSVVRTVLIWIAVIAVPVQGFAAATMVHCGPGHARQMTSVAPTQEHANHGDAHGVDDGHAGHLQVTSAPTHDVDVSADVDAASTAKQGMFKCSACAASCCIAIALLPMIATVATIDASTSIQPVPTFAARGFIPACPERPPRSFFA